MIGNRGPVACVGLNSVTAFLPLNPETIRRNLDFSAFGTNSIRKSEGKAPSSLEDLQNFSH